MIAEMRMEDIKKPGKDSQNHLGRKADSNTNDLTKEQSLGLSPVSNPRPKK
jgi:hypothetical protein